MDQWLGGHRENGGMGPSKPKKPRQTKEAPLVENQPSSTDAGEATGSIENMSEILRHTTQRMHTSQDSHPAVIQKLNEALKDKVAAYEAAGHDKEACKNYSMLEFGKFIVDLYECYGTFDNFVAQLDTNSSVNEKKSDSNN